MSRPGLTKRPATYADLLQVPDHLVAEILEGDLYTTPRPAAPHALATSALSVEIGGPFHSGRGGPGGWWILFEPELHLGPDVVVPDLAGWRRSTLPQIPNAPAITVAPDWICEVLSPSTEAMDRVPKLRIYARERVSHVWFVNPRSFTLEVLRLEEGRWIVAATHDGDQVVHAEPFDVVPLELFRLWGRNAPDAS
jgi:Uma2 family endonuclease